MVMNLSTLAIVMKYLEEMAKLDNIELHEVVLIGAGIGGGLSHTAELKVMNYCEARAVIRK